MYWCTAAHVWCVRGAAWHWPQLSVPAVEAGGWRLGRTTKQDAELDTAPPGSQLLEEQPPQVGEPPAPQGQEQGARPPAPQG